MTALPPIESRHVKGVASRRYPMNQKCSHPECSNPIGDKGHHIFPRSLIGNDSYFVLIEDEKTITLPHVTGLCRAHHTDVELHRAWIKLEDGVFVWYDRDNTWVLADPVYGDGDGWERVGPLDPQPGGREKVG